VILELHRQYKDVNQDVNVIAKYIQKCNNNVNHIVVTSKDWKYSAILVSQGTMCCLISPR
jgi:hypothetical protein